VACIAAQAGTATGLAVGSGLGDGLGDRLGDGVGESLATAVGDGLLRIAVWFELPQAATANIAMTAASLSPTG
jgi:hypothetical protein